MEENKIRVAITHGDTNGIGYEIILKTFADPTILELCTPIIYGSPKIAAYYRKMLDIPTNFTIINSAEEACDDKVNILATFDEEVKVDAGCATPESGEAALKALDCAMTDYRKGLYQVLVTAPVNNSTIPNDMIKFKGHCLYLQECLNDGISKAMTIVGDDNLKVALVTNNIPIKDVAQSITKETIIEKATIFYNSLRRDFRISKPRIAILSLNPKTVDGEFGREEKEIIIPAIDELEENDIYTFGPYTADHFFGCGMYTQFDGILAMYHDQGITPIKTLIDSQRIKYTAGLPIVHTSTAHGVCFDIAGKGTADETSLRNAIYAAIDIYRNRLAYDAPLENPLPKLYHEKRDDSEKVRFSIPKAREYNNRDTRNKANQVNNDIE